MTGHFDQDRCIIRAALLNKAFRPGEGWQKNGKPWRWMLDCREVLLANATLPTVGRMIYRNIRDLRPQIVAGTGPSGALLVGAVLAEAARNGDPLDGLLLRPEPKPHGRRRQIEGPLPPPSSRVVFVDDLINSGKTAKWAVDTLSRSGLKPVGAAAVVTFGRVGLPAVSGPSFVWRALFTLAELGIVRPSNTTIAEPDILWRLDGFNSDGDAVPFSRPKRCGNLVVAASNRGDVVAVDALGAVQWRKMADARASLPIHSAPLPIEHGVLIGSDAGSVTRLDTDSGAEVWSARYADRIGSGMRLALDGRAYVTATDLPRDGMLLCIDPADGQVFWRRRLAAYAHSRPVVADVAKMVLTADNGGNLTAFSTNDGACRWARHLGAPIKADPALDDADVCYVADFDGFLTALSISDGTVRWRRKLGRRLYATPTVNEAGLIVGSDGHAYCLDRRLGEVLWVAAVGRDVRGDIACLDDGTLVLSCRDGTVHFIDRRGQVIGQYATGGAATAGATPLGPHSALVASGDGCVYAFGTQTLVPSARVWTST